MPASLENSTVARGLEKISHIPVPKKGSAKECSNYQTIAFISHARKVMLKILQGRLQQYVDRELQKYKLDFEETEKLETKLLTCTGLWRKPESSKNMQNKSCERQD